MRQAVWLVEVALTDPDAKRLQIGGLGRIADAGSHLVRGDSIYKLPDDGTPKLARGPGDNNHGRLPQWSFMVLSTLTERR